MIQKTVQIEFDPVKDTINREKHGVSLADLADMNWDSFICTIDDRHPYGEVREIGYGLIENRLYCAVFVRKAQRLRVISFRKANAREVRAYVEAYQHLYPDR